MTQQNWSLQIKLPYFHKALQIIHRKFIYIVDKKN